MSEHHHKETFVTKYIFSQDHKMISKQFLITGMIMGVIGVFMSMLFRLQLAWPEKSFTIIEAFLGPHQTDGIMSPDIYLALVTIHGTIMVFFVLTAGLSGTFSNLLIPLQIGARDMASGFLNMISYWLFFISSVVMVISLFVEAGPASAGWTIYPPLSALPQAIPGSGLGMTLWLSLHGNFYCFFINWIIKLYRNSFKFTYKRNENDKIALNNVGILYYSNYWCCFFPSSFICSIIIDI